MSIGGDTMMESLCWVLASLVPCESPSLPSPQVPHLQNECCSIQSVKFFLAWHLHHLSRILLMKSMGEVTANPGGRVEERGESCWLTHYKQVNPGVMSTLVLPSSSPLWFALLLTCCSQEGFHDAREACCPRPNV